MTPGRFRIDYRTVVLALFYLLPPRRRRRTLARVLSRRAGESPHVQTTMTSQPDAVSAFSLRRSRATFALNLRDQNSRLVFGRVDSAQPCRCQKQPRTSMTVFHRGRTMSGLPGRRLSHTRNRNPFRKRNDLTIFSGRVSFPRIAAMISDRFAFENLSIRSQTHLHIKGIWSSFTTTQSNDQGLPRQVLNQVPQVAELAPHPAHSA